MRRNFLFALALCLAPTLLAVAFVARAAVRESQASGSGFRRGIDLAGGTILVYEVNVERSLRQKGIDADPDAPAAGLSSDDIKKLAENLKRRIDPADLRNVVVRPVGTTRVEIILPFTGSTGGDKAGVTEDFVQEVKNLVSQVGVLEFRIVANPTDDREAWADAVKFINDPANKAALEDRAKRGLPPPPPGRPYKVTVNGQDVDNTTYEWTELGREERETYGLSNAYEKEPPPKRRGQESTWLYPRVALKRGSVFEEGGMAIYSRDFVKTTPSKDEDGKKVEYFTLTRVSPLDALRVDRDVGLTATPDTRNLDPAVRFNLNTTGANRFGKITERNRKSESMKRQLAILLDDKIVSAPTLDGVIRDTGTISGSSFDQAGVNRLVYILKSGALNAELKPDPVSENTVAPTLGESTITKGLWAVALAFGAVLAFMVVYYRFAGLVACVALFANMLLTVGFMIAFNAAFTLPGLAGIVLMLGMAVDANVLIYERIREEREKGANLASAIRLGYDRAFGTIIDTHLTSIFTSVVLYVVGNDNLKGFAVALTVGLVISLFTSLYMTRLMFDWWQHKKWLSALRMMRLFARPNFDFMRIRHYMFALTVFLTVAGAGLVLYRDTAILNVDFTRGTAYGGRLKDGEERSLSDADGKAGLLTLLGEKRQETRLKVAKVEWLTPPVTADEPGAKPRAAEYIYEITYDDNSKATVTLVNAPDGATPEAQLADVRVRAGHLPGQSVEQVKLSGVDDNLPAGKTKSFTVRTTEKEPELVQVSLDRLLRDDQNQQLLVAANVTKVEVSGPTATLTLDRPASPGYLKNFIVRELKLAGRVPEVGGSPTVEVTGVPSADPAVAREENRSGRFSAVKVDVSQNPEFKALKGAAAGAARGAVIGPAAVAQGPAAKDAADFEKALAAAERAFEARPVPDRLETFDPALAADTRNQAIKAIILSWLAILAYLWFRFGSWQFGLAAVLCLIHDLAFTLGAVAVCHYVYANPVGELLGLHDFKIDLAAVAALLTLVGYSVNDTIVVFDRIREVRGKNPALTPQMINESVNGTLSRTVLAALTVFLVVVVLYWFGGEGVHLFAFVMVMGVVVGTYSSIYIAAPLLLIFGEGKGKAAETRAAPVATAPTEELVS